ncbi:hypothetical protein BLNAU_21336 [Blattamonas nauphoetae]|uniref:Uncharacterized protein n=1 Tax=Blattamonas nauphoetae TaxID=2049346 RepID=A0ABQ9WW61_9EUKA|nr:hypothetical protein BLNAU_21336 [Blattamonas nauphoetae]
MSDNASLVQHVLIQAGPHTLHQQAHTRTELAHIFRAACLLLQLRLKCSQSAAAAPLCGSRLAPSFSSFALQSVPSILCACSSRAHPHRSLWLLRTFQTLALLMSLAQQYKMDAVEDDDQSVAELGDGEDGRIRKYLQLV